MKTEDGLKCITAKWDGLDSYRSHALSDYHDGIESQDGDTWHDGSGNYATGGQFRSVEIRLIGGPRHGEIVS